MWMWREGSDGSKAERGGVWAWSSLPLLLLLPNQAKVRAAHCRLLLELLPTPADGDYNLLALR